MKGVILAGGLGSRLSPLTEVTNKHLLPVYDRPMIYYPLQNLARSGIDEVMVVTGGRFAGHFLGLLKNGKQFGISKLEYAYQEGEGGIAAALKLARRFVGNSPVCVMLGDNIYQYHVADHVQSFLKRTLAKRSCATVLAVPAGNQYDPTRFGVALTERHEANLKSLKPSELKEKPSKIYLYGASELKKSVDIMTGTYFYTPDVFDVCSRLKPSDRGELEITDVNAFYMRNSSLRIERVPGWWTDAGTFPSLLEASNLVRRDGANLGLPTTYRE